MSGIFRRIGLFSIVLVICGLAGPATGQLVTNSWNSAANGYWDTSSSWTLGQPDITQALVRIANAGSKTSTIDSTTSGSHADTLTISNLYLAGASGSTNSLFLTTSGTTTPLRVLKSFAIGTDGALRIQTGAVQVDGLSDGSFNIDGSVQLAAPMASLLTTGAVTYIGYTNVGSVSLSAGTWQAGNVVLGSNQTSRGSLALSGSGTKVSAPGTATLYIGYRGDGNSLLVSAGAKADCYFGLVGIMPESLSNSVLVTGADSAWSNSFTLALGYFGGWNTMVVSNGGTVVSGTGYIGTFVGSSNNSALVAGPSSAWSNQNEVIVGREGMGNALTIADGGRVYAADGYIGTNSQDNTLTVRGAGAQWVGSGDLLLGYELGRNSLVVSNGASVIDNDAYVGGLDSGNNSARITGSGSIWSNRNTLSVGFGGSKNLLTIDGGATVHDDIGQVGSKSGANNNTAMVIGNGSTWNNVDGLTIGGGGAWNALVVSNGAAVFNGIGLIGSASAASNNSVAVSGTGSVWSNRNELVVGHNGRGNELTIANGGRVYAANGYIGSNSQDNVLTVTGSNSKWIGAGNLYAGYYGDRNSLVVSNGAAVFNSFGYVGYYADADDNVVLVTGPGSVWSNRSDLTIGRNGRQNTMTVSNGATVFSDDGTIGFFSISDSNTAWIAGAGSTWSNRSNLHIGQQGSANTLVVSEGAAVVSLSSYIGSVANADYNLAQITGSGSVLSTRSDLIVGRYGRQNTLIVSNGAVVFSDLGVLGYYSPSDSNSAWIDGAGSVWSNRGDLIVGQAGQSNSLTVSRGGRVYSESGFIGSNSAANRVSIGGSNSAWLVSSNLYVGRNGSWNSMVISNGGMVANLDGYVGYDSTNNSVLVSGSGSIWTNRDELRVGYWKAGNTLVVSNGGAVFNQHATVGTFENSVSNRVVVTGAGSQWVNGGQFYVGSHGSENSLLIENGGWVRGYNYAYIGGNGHSNRVDVTGAGSTWSNANLLFVGYSGSGNRLRLADGGTFIGSMVEISPQTSATDNGINIDGGTLILTNMSGSGGLYVGFRGAGWVDMSDGTLRTDGLLVGGSGSSSSGNGVVDLRGGQMILGNDNVIGYAGTGVVNITGGDLTAKSMLIGFNSGRGTLNIRGGGMEILEFLEINHGDIGMSGGSLIATNAGTSITIGTGGDSQMTISNGTVTANVIEVGDSAGNPGTLNIVSGSVSGGAVVVNPSGFLRLEIPIDSVVSNLGYVQVAPNPYTFRGGFHNLGNFAVGGTQVLYVQNGLANSGSLVLNGGGVLTADGFADNRHNGTMFLYGGANLTVNTAWTNAGAIALEGGAVGGKTLHNADLVEGRGSINAPLSNRAGGTVRASGGLLSLGGSSVQNLAGGRMEALEGATLRIAKDFNNAGTIDNRGGNVDFSSRSLTNSGVLSGHGNFTAGRTVNNGSAIFNGGNLSFYGEYLNAATRTTKVDYIVANFHGAVTNNGLFKNTGSQVTFFSSFYNNGTYFSDPATNVFSGDLSLGPDGVLVGGEGDLFVIGGDLTVANPHGLQVADAGLQFDGEATMSLAGSANIGTLALAGDGLLTLLGADVSVGLLGLSPSQLTSANRVFYDPALNPSLGGQSFALDGGGSVLPIPEPGSALLILLGAGAAGLARKLKKRRS